MNGLLSTPIFWLAVTFLVFQAADTISLRTGRHPVAHPVMMAAPVLIAILWITHTPYPVYRDATQGLVFLLGPGVVGLAVPIWARRALIARMAVPIALALGAGAVTAIVSAVGILTLFGAPREMLMSIAPRATTTPVAMAVSGQLGGVPAVTSAIVLFAGIWVRWWRRLCSTRWVSRIFARAVSQQASPRMVSARRGRFRSIPWRAPLPVWAWR
jgi:putative effector of murein hydrolase